MFIGLMYAWNECEYEYKWLCTVHTGHTALMSPTLRSTGYWLQIHMYEHLPWSFLNLCPSPLPLFTFLRAINEMPNFVRFCLSMCYETWFKLCVIVAAAAVTIFPFHVSWVCMCMCVGCFVVFLVSPRLDFYCSIVQYPLSNDTWLHCKCLVGDSRTFTLQWTATTVCTLRFVVFVGEQQLLPSSRYDGHEHSRINGEWEWERRKRKKEGKKKSWIVVKAHDQWTKQKKRGKIVVEAKHGTGKY